MTQQPGTGMDATYGFCIRWTNFHGDQSAVSVSGFTDPKAAKDKCMQLAKDSGWTPPKWWKYWRYGPHELRGKSKIAEHSHYGGSHD